MKHIKLFEDYSFNQSDEAEDALEMFIDRILTPEYGRFWSTDKNAKPGEYILDVDSTNQSGDTLVSAEVYFTPEQYKGICDAINSATSEFQSFVKSYGLDNAEILTSDESHSITYQIRL